MDESIVKVFEEQKVGTLKLSQAIRIGAKLRPQARGMLFVSGASCAIGAAYEALYGTPPNTNYFGYAEAANRSGDDVEVLLGISSGMEAAIAGRNDAGHTREQIADWLESIGH